MKTSISLGGMQYQWLKAPGLLHELVPQRHPGECRDPQWVRSS